KCSLLGHKLINTCYFIMRIYGRYVWTRKVDNTQLTHISLSNNKQNMASVWIFIATPTILHIDYNSINMWTSWLAYTDTITTVIFFVGMWLIANRKVENWIFWIVGDLISIPLYFYKGFTFTSLQYLGFTIIAIYGYISWKNLLNKEIASV